MPSLQTIRKKREDKRQERREKYRETQRRIAQAEREAQAQFAAPVVVEPVVEPAVRPGPAVKPGLTSFTQFRINNAKSAAHLPLISALPSGEHVISEKMRKGFLNRQQPSVASASVAEPSFAVAESSLAVMKPPVKARILAMHELFNSSDSDSDMSVNSNSNSNSNSNRKPKKESKLHSKSELTRTIIDRKLVKTKVANFETLQEAIVQTKELRKFLRLDTKENPDCTVCSFYLYSKLLETSPDNITGFRAMMPTKFHEYSSYCRDHTCGGVSNTDIQNLLKDNGLTNMGIRLFRVESDNGIRVLLSEVLEPGETTMLYLPRNNAVSYLDGHVVLVYAHHSDGNYYIIDIQEENPVQITRLSDYKLSKHKEYANGGFIGLMIKDEKKVKRAMKRVTSQSGKQQEKSAGVNKDASVEYSELMREVEPTSPISVRKPKQDDSVNPKKRPRTSGGSKTRKNRK